MPERTSKNNYKVSFFTSFFRSQASSLVATAVDFSIYGILLYLFLFHYAVSSAIGNICGAIISFYLGRNWAFKSQEGKITHQAIKYAITSISSAGLNTIGIVYLTESFDINSTYSKIIVSLLIGFTFNFLMFRYFVYRK